MKLILKKEKILFKVDAFDEKHLLEAKKYIPKDAQNLEIVYNQKNKILKMDYVIFKEDNVLFKEE